MDDYVDMKLCEMYHCLPSQLDGEDYHRTQRHAAIKGAIETYQAREARSAHAAAARKKR